MKTLDFKGITVNVYTDAVEYANDHFDVPEGAILDQSQIPDSAGFACIAENNIAIYTTSMCPIRDLLSTVAHELGHLIEGGFRKNPPQKPRYDKRHEQKAEHYENFAMDAFDLTKVIHSIALENPVGNPETVNPKEEAILIALNALNNIIAANSWRNLKIAAVEAQDFNAAAEAREQEKKYLELIPPIEQLQETLKIAMP